MENINVKVPPEYCEYVNGHCDQKFEDMSLYKGFFLYPSEPVHIAATIENAVKMLPTDSHKNWMTWKDLKISGQIIFCSICKAIRFSEVSLADVTTLNFNLLFEIGFLLGLELPVIPIRDSSYNKDKIVFDELGMLDTIGYTDFQNSKELSEAIIKRLPISPIIKPAAEINFDAPLYVLKGPLETEGEVVLFSNLKKSVLRFRTFDTIETPRISLHTARKQVESSLGVLAHLLDPNRKGATVHNARCALLAGIAMAAGKSVLMLQESDIKQPIDYRDVVKHYSKPTQIPILLDPFILQIFQKLQSKKIRDIKPPEGLLEKLDIGDVAAENEIFTLKSYFVATGQYNQAKQGYARLVIGRKGSGKTAVFYAVRNSLGHSRNITILDLKPEGHQFTKFREVILSKLSPGLQEHTLAAFWNSILLSEIAHKVTQEEYSWAQREPDRWEKYKNILDLYEKSGYAEKGDFSERLLNQVDRLIENYSAIDNFSDQSITEMLYKGDIHELNSSVSAYLEEKEEVWILIDNLDKGWPVHGASKEDIMIIRTLLEATRKLQRQLERSNIDFHCLIFLRNDIYDLLVRETPDKGKDTPITLDWSDEQFFKEIFRRRVLASGLLEGTFDDVWNIIFEPNIGTRESFSYIIERTLMRPRDFLNFILRSIETAINRGHNKVTQDDILKAEELYSEDILKTIAFELKDIYAGVPDFLYTFLGSKDMLSKTEVFKLLQDAGIAEDDLDKVIKLLCWFGFLGVQKMGFEAASYSYEVRYDMAKLLQPINRRDANFIIHPAFRSALECGT